ncbi:hypothetical protein Lal_00025914 [Lupinus albus]|uniref:Uncharacterized protein n=1 Tax=Lupinus albus TaxID=3870 RepID=A0A6A4PYY7_LUPAL|nr:hypothetical protein Lalb_Chr09g0322791 [Lupinus albus]KAF1861553.1 hypothetical protein Lal_00025914 [Lupinus albus]
MGSCVSSLHSTPATKTTAKAKARDTESFRRASTIVVMDMKGRIMEYTHPIPASHVISDDPAFFLCNSESLYIGTCMPRVPDEEELLPGRIYFLVPLSQSHNPLSLTLLCDLAVKASYALANVINRTSLQRTSL